jgi:heme-degrading monooxygenase HmoA
MQELPFTLATYRVKSGREDEFIERWNGLAETFSSLDRPPSWGILLRSQTDRGLFHSFGPWEKRQDVEAMRSSAQAAAAFRSIHELCDELSPDDYDVVRHVRVRKGGEV